MGALTIEIPDQAEERLRRQATAAGKPIEQLLTDVLITQAGIGLRDISGPIAERFDSTGMSEQELADKLEREDHASRGVPYER